MDERLSTFAWTLAGAGAFAVLGALFGALAGVLSRKRGEQTGSGLGRRVAELLSRLFRGELTDLQLGALTGAADGALFLGAIGTLIGLAAGYRGGVPADWLVPAFLYLCATVGGALFFGALALALIRGRTPILLWVSVGGVMGALAAGLSGDSKHIVPAAVAGMAVGTAVGSLFERPPPS